MQHTDLYIMNLLDYRLVQLTVRTRLRGRHPSTQQATWHEAHHTSHELLHGLGHPCRSHLVSLSEIEADFGAMDLMIPVDRWAQQVAPLGPTLQPGDILGWRARASQDWESALGVPWERMGTHLLRTMGDLLNYSLWETYVINTTLSDAQLMALLKRDYPLTWDRWTRHSALSNTVIAIG